MTNLEFINKEIEKIKELLELEDVLCLKNDEDYKFWYDRLKMFQQIKSKLEAWEIVKNKNVDILEFIACANIGIYNKGVVYKSHQLTKDEYDKIKKALVEVK